MHSGTIPGHGQGHVRDPDLAGEVEDPGQGHVHVPVGAILDQG